MLRTDCSGETNLLCMYLAHCGLRSVDIYINTITTIITGIVNTTSNMIHDTITVTIILTVGCLWSAMQGPEASSHAHEAGYDAYMTGAAFACLVRLYEAAGSKPGQTQSKALQQPSLEAVQHLMGRLNIGRYPLLDSSLGNIKPGGWMESTSSAAKVISSDY